MTIVVAYDGSETGRRALEHAAELASPSARMVIVNVVPAQSVSARLETVSEMDRVRQRRLLRDARAVLRRRGLRSDVLEAAGDPVFEILSAAEALDAQLLVVGTGGPRHVLHRSVARRIVRRARCDVLVVPS
ncbi:MAG TPA: universal stress protein [Gaiellaceae bacterium]|nr:universal stress protein [Gaiellaceae bacterium]